MFLLLCSLLHLLVSLAVARCVLVRGHHVGGWEGEGPNIFLPKLLMDKQDEAALGKRPREALQDEVDALNRRIDAIEAEKTEWKQKAEEAQKSGDGDSAKFAWTQYELANRQLATLQERLLEKEKYERTLKQAKDAEPVKLVFQDFIQKDKRPDLAFVIECKRGYDFFGEAKETARKQSENADEDVFFFVFIHSIARLVFSSIPRRGTGHNMPLQQRAFTIG